MFTGLIREVAIVQSFDGKTLTISSNLHPKLGDSIAINGSCLTAVKSTPTSFSVELSHESLSLIAIENIKNRVHIEPAMKLGDRIEGHILQGHIDTTAKIKEIKKGASSYDFIFEIDKKFIKLIPPKGSIAIDGISLTVNEVFSDSFRLTIIPHTMKNTLFLDYKVAQRVNVETDMFARYLYHMFGKEKKLDWDMVDNIMAIY